MAQLDARLVVERFLREVLGGDGPATVGELISNPVLRERVGAFKGAFSDVAITPRVLFVDGEYVAVHLCARGTHRSTFQGVPATGRTWSANCTAIYRVHDGQIADFWVTWDTLAILEQLGGVQRAATASA